MHAPFLLGKRGPGAWVGSAGDGDGIDDPVVIDVNGDVTITGKVKAGSFGKFVFPLATIAVSRKYTFRVVANFSQLAQQGKLAMVGFGFKTGNDFHIAGLRGDGSTGTDEYIVHGTPPNGWNKQTGHTEVNEGDAAAGTQHTAYYRLTTSADGTTYKLETDTDGASYSTVVTAQALTPFSNILSVTTFGVALWFNNADAGPFSVQITAFADEVAAPVCTYLDHAEDATDLTIYTFSARTLSATGHNVIGVVGGSGTNIVSSMAVDGAAATLAKRQQQGSVTAEIWIAAATGDATGDVVVTWSGAKVRCAIAIWGATGLSSTTPVDGDGANIGVNANLSNVTLTTTVGGFVVGIGLHHNVTSGNIACRGMTARNESTLDGATVKVAAADAITEATSLEVGMDLNDGADVNTNSPYAVASFF